MTRFTAPLAAIAWLFAAAAFGQYCPDGNCPPPQAYYVPPSGAVQAAGFSGVPTAAAEHHRAIMRVGRGNGAGTGTLVWRDGDKGYLATAAHVVEGAGDCWVDWGAGHRGAYLCGADPQCDLAALYVTGLPELPTIPLAAGGEECPRGGEQVELAGFGGIRQWQSPPRHFAAPVLGYVRRDAAASDQIAVKFTSISGDSGGPIIYGGKLVGVLWGGPTDGHTIYETHGACATRIQECFQRWRVPCQPAPVVVQPSRPPLAPQAPPAVVEKPKPVTPAPKGCDCDGQGKCQCDPSKLGCQCDGDNVAKLEARIAQLELNLARYESRQWATPEDIAAAIKAIPPITAYNIDPKTGKPVGQGIVVPPGGKLGLIHKRTK